MASLDDILSEEKPESAVANEPPKEPPSEPPAVEAEKPPEYQSRKKAHQEKEFGERGLVRDPATGQFAPKKDEPKVEAKEEPKPEVKAEEKPAEPPKPEVPQMTEKERAYLAAAQDERRKRQELEARLKVLETGQTQAKPPEQPKTFWDDPEGHLEAQKKEIANREVGITLKVSEMLARSKYQDFDVAIAEFGKLAQTTPGLAQQMLASPDPAEFAYQTGKRHKALNDAGGIEAWRQQESKRIRMELEAELKARNEKLEKDRASLPPSLSDVRGTIVANKPVYNGPTPLDDILK